MSSFWSYLTRVHRIITPFANESTNKKINSKLQIQILSNASNFKSKYFAPIWKTDNVSSLTWIHFAALIERPTDGKYIWNKMCGTKFVIEESLATKIGLKTFNVFKLAKCTEYWKVYFPPAIKIVDKSSPKLLITHL